MAKQPQIGDIIEVYCEKCRLNLDASVAAVVGDEVKQVQCRTCGNFVPFKEPVPESVKKERVFKRVLAMRDRKTQRRSPAPMPTVTRRGAGRIIQEPPPTVTGADAAAPPRKVERNERWFKLTEQVDSRSALPYTPQRSFRAGEYLLHKTFGMGYVEKVEGEEAVVLFREGEETLPIDQPRDNE